MPSLDDQIRRVGARRLFARPEIGALVGAAVVLLFFSVQSGVFRSPAGIANWLDPASTLGIMAVAVALLMIGGEFDLSAGVMVGTQGLLIGTLSTEYHWNLWLAIVAGFGAAMVLGFANGYLLVRTRLPSFIVTLGTFLMLQGLNLGVTKLLTGTVQISGIGEAAGYASAHALFASTVQIGGTPFRATILWWVALTALASWALLNTRFGNWVFSVGGNREAARSAGVPVARTKIVLFMVTAGAAWLVGTMTALRLTSVQANAGIGEELIYITGAVIGGCLLTGGFGSAVGAALGALIFGMVEQGIVYLDWDSDWFKFFLGAMLLLAVITNQVVRRLAEETGR